MVWEAVAKVGEKFAAGISVPSSLKYVIVSIDSSWITLVSGFVRRVGIILVVSKG